MYRQMVAGSGADALVALKTRRHGGHLVIVGVRCGLRSRLTVKPNLRFRTGPSMTHSVFPPPI